MLDTIDSLDQQIFLLLNDFHNDFFDVVMYWVTLKYTWFPFYGLLVVFLLWKYRWQGLIMVLSIALSVALSDQFTSSFMKPFFERLRPCHNPELAGLVHVVDGCGGSFGFASSHAANAFGFASIVWFLLRNTFQYTWLLFIWAAAVAYSRIYVGVHYPGDIIVGSICGFLFGWFSYWLYTLVMGKMSK